MTVFWLILTIVTAVLEAVTVQLVSVWFAAGGLAACVVSLFTDDIIVQLGVFLGVTVLALALTRPLVRKLRENRMVSTNSDKYIGQTAIVLQQIDNESATGLVRVASSKWTARSVDGRVIAKGSRVKILSIEGVKLIVEAEENSDKEL